MAKPVKPIETATEQLGRGAMVIVADATGGKLTMAGELASPDAINFMARNGRGLICLALEDRRCRQLRLRRQPSTSDAPRRVPFMVSIEARTGVSTGISAADRARTIRVAVDRAASPHDLVAPGHVFPIAVSDRGVLECPRHAEAAVDLARLAGLLPAGVTCEVLDDRGMIAGPSALAAFAAHHGLPLIGVDDVIAHRHRTETRVGRTASKTRYSMLCAPGAGGRRAFTDVACPAIAGTASGPQASTFALRPGPQRSATSSIAPSARC